MIKTAIMIILSAFVVFAIGFISGVACAASGTAEHFEEAILKNMREKEEKHDEKI